MWKKDTFEDNNWIIRFLKSKKGRQCNGQKKKDNTTNNGQRKKTTAEQTLHRKLKIAQHEPP
jgi:hypothetical protein